MTELLEVIGESNFRKGSFLDLEENWRETGKEFKDRILSHGNAFKCPRVLLKNRCEFAK